MADQNRDQGKDRGQDRNQSAQGGGDGGNRMSDAIDKAKDMKASDLPEGHGGDEAERTRRVVDAASTGNVPHGGDDPQHHTSTPMTPMPNQTGGKGNVGDTSMKDGGGKR